MVNQMIKIPEGCVLWLDLTEPTGNVVYDHSGHGNNGKVYGAVLEKRLPFIGRRFDGVDDYVEVPDSPSLNSTDEITLIVWSVRQEFGDLGTMIGKSYQYLLAYHDSDTIYFNYYDGSAWVGSTYSNRKITDSLFHLIAATYSVSRGTVQIFVDGDLDNEKSVTANPINVTTNKLSIGYTLKWSPSWYLKGLIAHVSIYNRALTVKEIKYLYEEFQKRVFRRIDPLNIRMR